MIRVILPPHLRTLANVGAEVALAVEGPVTQRSVLDALEARYPMLRGTIRYHVTHQRRQHERHSESDEQDGDAKRRQTVSFTGTITRSKVLFPRTIPW